MSYSIVKKLSLNNNKCIMTYACNNVYPRHWFTQEIMEISEMLEQGWKEQAEQNIMLEFWSGMLQGSESIYRKAADLMPFLYPDITWQKVYGYDKTGEFTDEDARKALSSCLDAYRIREKGSTVVYLAAGKLKGYWLTKTTDRAIHGTTYKAQAKKFESALDAKIYAGFSCWNKYAMQAERGE